MKKAMILASAAMISIALLSGGAGAQGTPQTVELVKVDVHKLAAGYRASKVIGSSVVNDANETIGKMKVVSVLESLPGLGKVKARRLMETVGISDSRRLQGLGAKQRESLLKETAR